MPTALPGLRSAVLGALPLHVTADDGVDWTVEDLTGWRGSPATTVQVAQKPGGHGGWATSRPWLTPRQMELRVLVSAPTPAALDTAYEQLLAAAGNGPVLLQVTEGSLTRKTLVYRNGDVFPVDDSDYHAVYSVPLIAPDPRRYGAEVITELYLPTSTGGLTLPLTLPLTISATVISGMARLDNAGSVAAPLRLVVYGPVSQPQITVTDDAGDTWTLTYSGDISAGDWVDIDTEAATVLYNGQASRRSLLSGDWPSVPPGGADIAFRAPLYSAAARLTVAHRAAWM
ncbi:hypothetical protein AB4225_06040 [Streptomyces sp. 2RAF24]|uniref:phage distal tail protein n=1 Tax=Streptomyces sp. 2RAF24 TaxID=3232997 RepID=UPI003F9B883C